MSSSGVDIYLQCYLNFKVQHFKCTPYWKRKCNFSAFPLAFYTCSYNISDICTPSHWTATLPIQHNNWPPGYMFILVSGFHTHWLSPGTGNGNRTWHVCYTPSPFKSPSTEKCVFLLLSTVGCLSVTMQNDVQIWTAILLRHKIAYW